MNDINITKMAYALHCAEYTSPFEYPVDFDYFLQNKSMKQSYETRIESMIQILGQDEQFIGITWYEEMEFRDDKMEHMPPSTTLRGRLKVLANRGTFYIDKFVKSYDHEEIPCKLLRENIIQCISHGFADYISRDEKGRQEFLTQRH